MSQTNFTNTNVFGFLLFNEWNLCVAFSVVLGSSQGPRLTWRAVGCWARIWTTPWMSGKWRWSLAVTLRVDTSTSDHVMCTASPHKCLKSSYVVTDPAQTFLIYHFSFITKLFLNRNMAVSETSCVILYLKFRK